VPPVPGPAGATQFWRRLFFNFNKILESRPVCGWENELIYETWADAVIRCEGSRR
jgi:hypothetical protein